MKKTSQEIITALEAYKEAMGEDFLNIIEDVADSVVEASEPDYSGYVKKEDYDALQQRYIDRFKGVDVEIKNDQPVMVDPETPAEGEFDIEDAVKAYSEN